MKRFNLFLLGIGILFFHSSFLYSQVKPDSLEIQTIRSNIPGKTIGEKLESLLFWSQREREQRFSIMHYIYPSTKMNANSTAKSLLVGTSIQPKWENETTIDSYIKDNHIRGIIVLKEGEIRLERYGENSDTNTLWTSFSVAKSITSMLIGAAHKEGYIKSLDDQLERYIPELQGYDYGKVTVRELITMTTGMDWNEDYADPQSDVAQMYLKPCNGEESHILTYMKSIHTLSQRENTWNYNTGETDLAGILVQNATGKKLSEYLAKKIWQPMGMQFDGFWLADECSGLNIGGSGISASLRDYARLGKLMLQKGNINGHQVFSKEWINNATVPYHLFKNKENGYGYLWWTFEDGSYAAFGIFGQLIYIHPELNLVIVQLATWPKASSSELSEKRKAFIKAVKSVF